MPRDIGRAPLNTVNREKRTHVNPRRNVQRAVPRGDNKRSGVNVGEALLPDRNCYFRSEAILRGMMIGQAGIRDVFITHPRKYVFQGLLPFFRTSHELWDTSGAQCKPHRTISERILLALD